MIYAEIEEHSSIHSTEGHSSLIIRAMGELTVRYNGMGNRMDKDWIKSSIIEKNQKEHFLGINGLEA